MHCAVLQDWITIRGQSQSPAVPIPQSEVGWLDLSPYQDVFFWLDVREVTGSTPTMTFETSPAADDNLFQQMVSPVSVQVGTTVVRAPMTTATTPIARYLRWKLTGPVSTLWDVTFRVLVAANSPGM